MKKFIGILLAVLLCLTLPLTAVAAELTGCAVTADTVAGAPGETVAVAVSIADHPGFTNFAIALDYDRESLTLKSIDTEHGGSAYLCGDNVSINRAWNGEETEFGYDGVEFAGFYGHTAEVVARVSRDPALRWAALLHDVGKPHTFSMDTDGRGHFYGHTKESAALADGILRRLKAPTALRERVVLLIRQHMTTLTPDRRLLRRRLSSFGPEALHQLLALQEADWNGRGVEEVRENGDFGEIRRLLAEIEAENACLSLKDLAVNGHDLMAAGLTGPAIGRTLNQLLSLVLDEQLPNEKNALLKAATQEETL